ncbi:MAG: Crp/Fnr family transcriptional regulator [Lactimicrobium sp.]|jgi:CRP-like cAMP-binding protein|uniref:Crp/Fnr family transcriptional regulator n=1 Tax=Lactimicrobium sp. TaxID=2563780 RepID=UPI002F34F42A
MKHLCVALVPLFNTLSETEQEEINSLTVHKSYEKHEQVFAPGDEKLSIVAHGRLKVYQVSANGREMMLRVVKTGEFEGENQLFGIQNENLYGEALEDTEICSLSKSAFDQVMMKNPKIALKLVELSGQKMVQLEKQTQILSLERVEERLGAYLLDLARQKKTDFFILPVKMKDLAMYLGTTPETLSRKLKYLEDEKMIARDGKTITILEEGRLSSL